MANDSAPLVLGRVDAELTDEAVVELWRRSGAGWLTDPGSAVPGGLVRRVAGLVDRLDPTGTAFGDLVDARGLGFLTERSAHLALMPSGVATAGGAGRMLEADGGWLAVSLARSDDIDSLEAWLGSPISGLDWDAVSAVVGRARVAELLERAILLGLPCALVGETTDDRPAIAARLGAADPLALEGALVVNLASLWAGPLAADVLARLGAQLITVESTSRPDGSRRTPGFFRALHGFGESVALDLATREGRAQLARLVEAADIVIEGSRPRALRQLGIDVESLLAGDARGRSGPSIWLSITGHGRHGPAADRVGFGDDAAAAGGLVGRVDGAPRFVADAVADPLTGLTAAVAAAELAGRGGRWLVDVAMARASRSAAGGEVPVGAPSCRPAGVPPRPRARRDPGGDLPLGRDTAAVLARLGEPA